jgi:hypothetical protein
MPIDDPELQWTILALAPNTWIDILLNFVIATVYAFCVSLIYRQCRGLHTNRSFIQTLYMLTLIITLIMMVIMSVRGAAALAVAFGLMGALSIIRFRTVVKDNRDTAFVFLAVGAGMAAGTGQWWIGFTGITFVGVILIMLEHAPWRGGYRRVIVKVTFRPGTDEANDTNATIASTLTQLGNRIQMLHVRTLRLGELIEATYSLNLFQQIEPNFAINQLLSLSGVDNVNIFNPSELQEP